MTATTRVAALVALVTAAAAAGLPTANAQFGCNLANVWSDSEQLRNCLADEADPCVCTTLYDELLEASEACSSLLGSTTQDLLSSTADFFADTCETGLPTLSCSLADFNANFTVYSTCAANNAANLCECRPQFDHVLEHFFSCVDLLTPALRDSVELTSAFYSQACAPAGALVEFSSAAFVFEPPAPANAASASTGVIAPGPDAFATITLTRSGDLRTSATATVALFERNVYTSLAYAVSFPAVAEDDGGADATQDVDLQIDMSFRRLAGPDVLSITAILNGVEGANTGAGDRDEATLTVSRDPKFVVAYPSAGVQWLAAAGDRHTVARAFGSSALDARVDILGPDGHVAEHVGNLTMLPGFTYNILFEQAEELTAQDGYVLQLRDLDDASIIGQSEAFTVGGGDGDTAYVEFDSWTPEAAPTVRAGQTVLGNFRARGGGGGGDDAVLTVTAVGTGSPGGTLVQHVRRAAVTAAGDANPPNDIAVSFDVPHSWVLAGATSFFFVGELLDSDQLARDTSGEADLEAPFQFTVGEWSDCSTDCGDGVRTRDVTCTAVPGGDEMAARMCEMYSPAPAAEEPCVLAACAPLPADFRALPWGSCSRTCGGGTQSRTVECVDANGDVQSDNTACNALALIGQMPATSRVCNTQPCETFSWTPTPWRACTAGACGNGREFRDVVCKGSASNIDPSGLSCLASGADGAYGPGTWPQFARACTGSACFRYIWQHDDWATCSKTCGSEGVTSRTVWCYDTTDEATVADGFCSAATKPETDRSCNLALCADAPQWVMGAWTDCSSENGCGGGQRTRTVTCTELSGAEVDDAECATSGAKPADTQWCDMRPCDPCEGIDCFSPNGQCVDGFCVCAEGFSGARCGVAEAECGGGRGVAAADGGCCASGVTKADGTCCESATAQLDAAGECCASGVVDACGVCDGTGVLDVVGACCTGSGALDAAGVCCASGNLDVCGVCSGTGDTCAITGTVTIDAPAGSSGLSLLDGSLPSARLASVTLPALLAGAMGVAESDVLVESVMVARPDPSARGRRVAGDFGDLSGAALDVSFTVDSSVPADTLLDALHDSSDVSRVVGYGTTGVCGNGVCEFGEACVVESGATLAGGGCCVADCPLVRLSCPVSVVDLPGSDAEVLECGGPHRGTCVGATGQCSCHDSNGYTGEACGDCGDGFTFLNGRCIVQYDVAGAPAEPPPRDPSDGDGLPAYAIALIIVAVVVVAALVAKFGAPALRRDGGRAGGGGRHHRMQRLGTEASMEGAQMVGVDVLQGGGEVSRPTTPAQVGVVI